MPPPPPLAVAAFGCTVNVMPSAPGPSASDEPPGSVIRKANDVLNALPRPSGMIVRRNAEPLRLGSDGVTRNTPATHAALSFSCSFAQSAKLRKLTIVTASAGEASVAASSTIARNSRALLIATP